jgi:LCP family protein required for cell wall assembly
LPALDRPEDKETGETTASSPDHPEDEERGDAAEPAKSPPKRPIKHRRIRKLAAILGVAALTVVLGLSADAAALTVRIERFDIPASVSAAHGETWVVVGTDSRYYKPEGRDIYQEGGIPGGIGERADIVLVVLIVPGEAARILSIPRDLILPQSAEGSFERLASALELGEPELVHALCAGLGIPTDHMVKVTLRGFVETVDALGGLTINLPYSTRDFYSFLEPTGAGVQTFDGDTALSFVRSRHPEYLIGERWYEADLQEGSSLRTANAAVALSALQQAARTALVNPVKAQRAAWAVSGGFQLDSGTSLWSLARLARAASNAQFIALPAQATGTELAVVPDDSTFAALSAAGFAPGSCQVSP